MPKVIRPREPSQWRSHRRFQLDRATGRGRRYPPLNPEELKGVARLMYEIYAPSIRAQLEEEPLIYRLLKAKGGHNKKAR